MVVPDDRVANRPQVAVAATTRLRVHSTAIIYLLVHGPLTRENLLADSHAQWALIVVRRRPIERSRWCHVVIAATGLDALRPDIDHRCQSVVR